MSETELKPDDKVPTETLCTRLDELADAVSKGDASLRNEVARRLRAVQSVLPDFDTRTNQPRHTDPSRDDVIQCLLATQTQPVGIAADAIMMLFQPRPAVPDSLTEWLEREMPAGTIIGDPKWWASRIAKALLAAKQPEGGNEV